MSKKRLTALCAVILIAVLAFIISLASEPENMASNPSEMLARGRTPIERVGTPLAKPAAAALVSANSASTSNTAPNRLQDAVAPPPMVPILPPDMPDAAHPPQGTQPLAVPEAPVAPDPFVLPALAVDEQVRYLRRTPVPPDLYAPQPASADVAPSN
jgi:hypothetical protein